MKIIIYLFFLQIFSNYSSAQDKLAYIIYNSKGKKVTYSKMVKELKDQDLILFGEFHDNPISHWLQLELTKELSTKREVILGGEMFEADNQNQLNNFLSGEIDSKQLDSTARLWKNYKTDYSPLVNFAKENSIPFKATNIPRKYARLVNKGGFTELESLSLEEKLWIAPLPIAYDSSLSTYQDILLMMGDHGTQNLVKAQAIKDATMAYFISKNIEPTKLFIHLNGAFHSDYYQGIGWYIKQYNITLSTKTISTVSQNDIGKLNKDNIGKADFIICVVENMTSTH